MRATFDVWAAVVLAPAPEQARPEPLPASGSIEIMLSGGHAVRVDSGFDATTLARVLDVLEARPC